MSRGRFALAVFALLALGLALAPAAGAKIKTDTFSSGPLGTPVGDNAAAASRIALPKGKIKDVNVLVRLTHGVVAGGRVGELGVGERGRAVADPRPLIAGGQESRAVVLRPAVVQRRAEGDE